VADSSDDGHEAVNRPGHPGKPRRWGAVVRQRFRETHRRGHRDAARSPGHFHMTLMSTQWRTRSHLFARNCWLTMARLMACLLPSFVSSNDRLNWSLTMTIDDDF